MGVMDKLMFWKKDSFDDFKGDSSFDSGKDPFSDMGSDPFATGPDNGSPGLEPMGQEAPLTDGMGAESAAQSGFNTPPPSTFQTGVAQANPMGSPGSFSPPPVNPAPPMHHPPQEMSDKDFILTKNMEVLSSKLDAMRSALDIINQRLENIERLARGEEKKGW